MNDVGFHALGSDEDFWTPLAGVGWTWQLGDDGFFAWALNGQTTLESDGFRDDLVSGGIRLASPSLDALGRLVVRGRFALRFDRTKSLPFAVGTYTALRGVPAGALVGEKLYLLNFEARSRALSFRYLSSAASRSWTRAARSTTPQVSRPRGRRASARASSCRR